MATSDTIIATYVDRDLVRHRVVHEYVASLPANLRTVEGRPLLVTKCRRLFIQRDVRTERTDCGECWP